MDRSAPEGHTHSSVPSPAPPPAPHRTEQPKRLWVLLFVAVCLVAVNLRMTIAGVGPLLEQIADDEDISPAALGALGSVPLLGWAIFSPFAHGLSQRLGLSRAVSFSLMLLIVGTVWRSVDGSPANLWVGTAITGAGLAVANVLMPAVIKRDFAGRVGFVMGVYSALLGGLGAIAAGVVVPISQLQVAGEPLGWRFALLATGSMLPLALVVWIWVSRLNPARAPRLTGLAADSGRTAGRRVWKDPVAWLVSLYMGAQSTGFYVLSTWLPTYLVALGATPTRAGLSLMTFQFLGIAGSLLVPLFTRGRLERWIPALTPAIGAVAWVGLIAAPNLMPLWIFIAGVVSGALLTTSLMLMTSRSRTLADSSAVSGMAQSVGYSLAALGPLAFGVLHGLTTNWALPFSVLWIAGAFMIIVGVAVGRPRLVFAQ